MFSPTFTGINSESHGMCAIQRWISTCTLVFHTNEVSHLSFGPIFWNYFERFVWVMDENGLKAWTSTCNTMAFFWSCQLQTFFFSNQGVFLCSESIEDPKIHFYLGRGFRLDASSWCSFIQWTYWTPLYLQVFQGWAVETFGVADVGPSSIRSRRWFETDYSRRYFFRFEDISGRYKASRWRSSFGSCVTSKMPRGHRECICIVVLWREWNCYMGSWMVW